jgi:hypothetical protein
MKPKGKTLNSTFRSRTPGNLTPFFVSSKMEREGGLKIKR